jgi:hypothetical protein
MLMRAQASCTTVVLLLGDPFTLGDELPATLAGANALGLRAEVLLVCDGPAWRQHPAVQRYLLHGPRPGLLQTRSTVDHPAPLVNLALEWLRTPYFHLTWPGVSLDAGAARSLLDALETHPTAAVAHAGEEITAHGSMIRVAPLRAAGGVDAALILQTALDLDLAVRLRAVGEVVPVSEGTCPEPRWGWREYPFLKRWPVPSLVIERYLESRHGTVETVAA